MGLAESESVYGFDELMEAFDKVKGKYDNKASAMLNTIGKAMTKSVKAKTKKKTGNLKKSWRFQNAKKYRDGEVLVVRVLSQAPHAHLVEYGHENIRGGRTRVGRVRFTDEELDKMGIERKGRTEGVYMLEKTVKEYQNLFKKNAEKLLQEITKDLEV